MSSAAKGAILPMKKSFEGRSRHFGNPE